MDDDEEDKCETTPLKRQKLNDSQNFICPITREVFKNPVIIDDGNTYEKEAILKYLDDHDISPITRQPVNKSICIPNRAIKSTIENAHQNNILFEIPTNKSVQTRNISYNENINLICFEDTNEVVSNQLLKVVYKNGNVYCGTVNAGKREGRGVMTHANGHKYDGEFKNDKKEGRGVYTFADGDKYDGEFKNSNFEGHGVMTFSNVDKYDGEFKNDNFEGRGVMTFANGDKYDGEFKNGKRQGRGIMTFVSGNKYDGDYKNDKKEGRGIMTFADGAKYDGEFKNGKRQGRGIMTFANRSIYKKYDGEFKNDKKEGCGVMTYANGSIYNGQWENDGHRYRICSTIENNQCPINTYQFTDSEAESDLESASESDSSWDI